MNLISKKWEEHNKNLDSITLKNIDVILKSDILDKFILYPFGANDVLMKWELDRLTSYITIEEDFNILEVGSGVGNFCKTLQEKFVVDTYTILDTPSMLRISKFFLNHYDIPYTAVSCDDYEELSYKDFDLCVSNLCMSELPEDYRDSLLVDVLCNCKYAFFIDTVKPEFAEDFINKLRNYSKFNDVKYIKYDDFYLPNHGVFFASRN